MGLGQIVKRLIKEKRTTGSGGLGWNKESVRRILLNRKYSGDVVLQMTITEDLITKHRVVNNGQAPQYVVIDGIPPIISRQVYYLAQGELERRGHMIYHSGEKFIGPDVTSYKNGFTGKLKCSCGANYNRVNVKKAYAWKCYNRIHGECKSEMIKEKELEAVVLKAAQELYDGAPKIEFCKVPVLSEESTPAEKMEAAAVYMENMFLKRVQTFAEGARPSEYSMDLLDMIELITLTDSFHVRFYTGQIIMVDRIAVRAEKPQESQIETVSETVTYFGLTGEPRKRLAQRLAALTGEKLVYLGFPSMAFKVGDLVVKRDGTVEGRLSKKVLKGLERSGFYVVGREA
jgi:hypothetical protein